jgi:GT2 family glycosyltransferase
VIGAEHRGRRALGAPDVSVVLVHRDRPERLRACLDALSAGADRALLEVIVVDDGSHPERRADLRTHRGLSLIANDSVRGPAASLNRGAAVARAQALLFLGIDVELEEGTIAGLLEWLANDTRLAAVAPVRTAARGEPRPAAMRFLTAFNHAASLVGWPGRRSRVLRPDGRALADVDWASTAMLLVRTDVFRALAGFDEGFQLYEYDEDFCWRARRRGYRLAVARDLYVTDRSADAHTWTSQHFHRAQMRFLGRRRTVVAVLLYRVCVSAALLARAAVGSVPRRRDGRSTVGALLGALWSGRRAPRRALAARAVSRPEVMPGVLAAEPPREGVAAGRAKATAAPARVGGQAPDCSRGTGGHAAAAGPARNGPRGERAAGTSIRGDIPRERVARASRR